MEKNYFRYTNFGIYYPKTFSKSKLLKFKMICNYSGRLD